ncbi:hypothetical protein FY557_17275 [Chryseobacterium sp. SN22]|uniref:hypothetical protein n=1 Tax=Chryseobacterium sp. SN22 TaxID=2606431 RepID=UPI0011EF6917|nr:hypothetical protein [Chryseobacterium sp. SN22]KAA0126402.1 hypothetical protein FY557_17275 [Chryseobacterium sp. SN22]
MRKDFKAIKALISKNEYFHKNGMLEKYEYAENCLLFASKIDVILQESDRITIRNFINDEFSFPKFKLSVSVLKAIPN